MLYRLCVPIVEMVMIMIRTYKDLSTLKTFEQRFNYLKLLGAVGAETFGFDRYINQILYHSKRWRMTRNEIIVRDNGCDLGHPDYPIYGLIIIHHMNPITISDVENDIDELYDPRFLISSAYLTHRAVHYGDEKFIQNLQLVERRPNDTCPWR